MADTAENPHNTILPFFLVNWTLGFFFSWSQFAQLTTSYCRWWPYDASLSKESQQKQTCWGFRKSFLSNLKQKREGDKFNEHNTFFAHRPSPSSFLENKMLGCTVSSLKLWRQKSYAKDGGAAQDWPSFDFLLRKKTNAKLTQFSHGNQIYVIPNWYIIQFKPPPHFIGELTKAQRGTRTFPRSTNQWFSWSERTCLLFPSPIFWLIFFQNMQIIFKECEIVNCFSKTTDNE